ncbi:DUF6571 family protein [uncultured Actinomyces sp.]|uniref:DUF6571 family protein n=1 Tax=uncultured Actinomyces sp. TaxID=249061 RepID=UPI0028DC6F65|nr:DUF6571 family protein [uncultured Actinomyces sp.]
MMLVGCLVLPTCPAIPRAAATPPPDTPTTQVISATAPAPTTSPTSPGTATGGGAATNAQVDTAGADAARGDAVVLAGALEGGDYAVLAQVVGERVAPHTGGGAYATALVDALGARGIVRVAAHLPTGEGGATSAGAGAGDVPHPALVWTSLLATATSSPLWDEGHREALARDLASLVTTTGDVAEADTLLLPLGFRRLLTADQDPLTAAAAATRTPGAGDNQAPDSEDVRDPLALDPKFLAALTRGVMTGETTGGSRVGWVEYARLTTTAGGGYSNFPEGTPQDMTTHRASYDPLPAVLTATARTPTTVLDILAPPLPGPDPSTPPSEEDEFRRILATQVDGSLWAWVAARTQKAGPAYLEALTAAVASASTLRYRPTTSQPNTYEAQAAWLTEQATTALAGVDTTTWTPTARRTTAVTLANSVGDLWDAARDDVHFYLFQTFYNSLPTGWSKHHNEELTALLREVLRDDTALTILSKAARIFITHRLATDAFRIPPGTSTGNTPTRILNDLDENARLYGYVYTACVTGRGGDKDEASPAAGVVLAALDQGPAPWSLDPHTLWQPLADPAQATQATTTSGSSLTQGQLRGEIASRLSLEAIGVLDAARLIPQDAYTLEDGQPAHD